VTPIITADFRKELKEEIGKKGARDNMSCSFEEKQSFSLKGFPLDSGEKRGKSC